MRDINGLISSLKKYLGWNKCRVNCFTNMLLSLFSVRTVNLHEIALAYNSKTQPLSRYRRLQRFLAYFEIDFAVIARWIFHLCLADQDKFYLIIDRTNWYIGRKKVNIFMLAVAYEGIAIPLFWNMLDKAGNSNFEEQRRLINDYLNVFGKEKIAGLLADREFMNGKFFGWLNKKRIPFYIRIKEQDIFNMSATLFGQKVFLAGSRSGAGELMIVATNQQPKNAIAIYLRRWEIENLFQGLKSRGFRFEETHLTCLDRIKKLTAVLAIGFVWAHRVGEWLAIEKPIKMNKFFKQKRPQNTYFRYGLDYIRNIIFQEHIGSKAFKKCLNILFNQKLLAGP